MPTRASTTTMLLLLRRRRPSDRSACFTHRMSGPATRVTAGASRGRLLKTPPGRATRPTTSLVREALFNIIGDSIRGARVLDLFAGAGTLGIEALSRGAASATFVERDRACANIVAENLAATGFAQQGDVVSADAIDWLAARTGDLTSYNLLLLDPPYRDGETLTAVLEALDQAPLRDQAMLVVEHHRSQPLPPLRRLSEVRQRDYGATRLTFFRYR
jgi:16S rRNA (guanine966-N2)-methyltransferase